MIGFAAKRAPVTLPVLAGGAALAMDGHTALRISAVIVGLAFGAMWRAGSLRSEGKVWADVRADLFVSILIGGANAVLALWIANWTGVGILAAMAIGVITGATGLRALPEIKDAVMASVIRRSMADTVMLQPRDRELDHMLDVIDKLDQPPRAGERNGTPPA